MAQQQAPQTPMPISDPAQAFAALQTEVAAVSQALSALKAAQAKLKIPDYSPSLEAIVQGFEAQGQQLRALEQRGPMAERALNAAGNRLAQAAHETEQQRRQLSDLIGRVHARRAQRQWLVGIAVLFCALGIALAPLVFGWLPFGLDTMIAATILRTDRWQTGSTLMHEANPSLWSRILINDDLIQANEDAVARCRAIAAKTGKAQTCKIIVKPVGH